MMLKGACFGKCSCGLERWLSCDRLSSQSKKRERRQCNVSNHLFKGAETTAQGCCGNEGSFSSVGSPGLGCRTERKGLTQLGLVEF